MNLHLLSIRLALSVVLIASRCLCVIFQCLSIPTCNEVQSWLSRDLSRERKEGTGHGTTQASSSQNFRSFRQTCLGDAPWVWYSNQQGYTRTLRGEIRSPNVVPERRYKIQARCRPCPRQLSVNDEIASPVSATLTSFGLNSKHDTRTAWTRQISWIEDPRRRGGIRERIFRQNQLGAHSIFSPMTSFGQRFAPFFQKRQKALSSSNSYESCWQACGPSAC